MTVGGRGLGKSTLLNRLLISEKSLKEIHGEKQWGLLPLFACTGAASVTTKVIYCVYSNSPAFKVYIKNATEPVDIWSACLEAAKSARGSTSEITGPLDSKQPSGELILHLQAFQLAQEDSRLKAFVNGRTQYQLKDPSTEVVRLELCYKWSPGPGFILVDVRKLQFDT